MIQLSSDTAHLWYVVSDAGASTELTEACAQFLAPDELARQARFHFACDRHRYLLKRALVRAVLSCYFPVHPREWTFVRDQHGRPSVAHPTWGHLLRFSLSSAPGLVACLVGWNVEVGVDVEDVERSCETLGLADRFFTPAEVRALSPLSPTQRWLSFIEYWTLKESYVKARGLGLAIPFDSFALDISERSRIRVSFGPGCHDDARAWQFSLHHPSARYVMAMAARAGRDRRVSIDVRPLSLGWVAAGGQRESTRLTTV